MILGYYCIVLCLFSLSFVKCDKIKTLSRKKRYLTFPEGSSFSAAFCLTAQAIGPAQIFTEAVAWGIAYDLPNDTSKFKQFFKHPKHVLQRRHRRELYDKVETLMASMGIDGKACVLKTLCEVGQMLTQKRDTVIEQLLWTVFRFPIENFSLEESNDLWEYYTAHKNGIDKNLDCTKTFWQCPYSFFDIFLGFLNK